MTVKERILAAMSWEEPDRIPLTVFEMLFPRSEAAIENISFLGT